mgnify:CR=1 FL=1
MRYAVKHLNDLNKTLAGKALEAVQFEQLVWSFRFGNYWINECASWRLCDSDGIYITSEDHEHSFGVGYPIDAKAEIEGQLSEYLIWKMEYIQSTGDLKLMFKRQENDYATSKYLEVLSVSSGYESWTMTKSDDPNSLVLIGQPGNQIDAPIHQELIIQDN